MAVKLYSDNSTQITNFNLLRTGFRATHRHECLPAERWRALKKNDNRHIDTDRQADNS